MKLALFDIDHTLLPIDSADRWSHFFAEKAGKVDEIDSLIRGFARSYADGTFDIEGYLAFQMGLLASRPRAELDAWRAEYVEKFVRPAVCKAAVDLVEQHRAEGWELALVTGTNAYVTTPTAQIFNIPSLLAAQPEEGPDGNFTGRYVGSHSYGVGKIRKVEEFLAARGLAWEDLEDCRFFSDSRNDIPLLELVASKGGEAVATNPDPKLTEVAAERGWRVLHLFETIKSAM